MTHPLAKTPPPATLEERIERALVTAAELVAVYGDDYVLFFERLETELHALRQRANAAERARQIAARARSHGNIADCLAITRVIP